MRETIGDGPSLNESTMAALLNRIEARLWPNGFRHDIWMIIDAARDECIFGLLLECFYSQHTCLFSGPLAPEIEVVAPYLVKLDYEDPRTRRFITAAWGKSWGVFLKSDAQMDKLRRHLRTILVVRNERGERLMFRYYDPRILRVYLPTCTIDELYTVFGPISRFYTEDDGPDTMLEFCVEKERLVHTGGSRDPLIRN